MASASQKLYGNVAKARLRDAQGACTGLFDGPSLGHAIEVDETACESENCVKAEKLIKNGSI